MFLCFTVEPESPQDIKDFSSHDCAVKFSTDSEVPVPALPDRRNMTVTVAISTIVAMGGLLMLITITLVCAFVCHNKRKVKRLKKSVTAGIAVSHNVVLHHDNQFDALNHRTRVQSNHSYVINSLGGYSNHFVTEQNRSHLVESSHSYVIQSLGQSNTSGGDGELYWPPASKEGDLKQQLKKSNVNEVLRNDIE